MTDPLDYELPRLDIECANLAAARHIRERFDDWLAHYDTELTVDEHWDVYSRSSGRGLTMREAAPHFLTAQEGAV